MIVFIHIFIQVSLNQFLGYVTKLIGELYDSWRQWLRGDSGVKGHSKL